jgi:Methyltransferase FkbM domain
VRRESIRLQDSVSLDLVPKWNIFELSLYPLDQSIFVTFATLDNFFANRKVDILKIDVEGFEFHVLRGGANLLHDEKRTPRAIFVELLPVAWDRFRVSGRALLQYLVACGYNTFNVSGNQPIEISEDGEIVARSH